MTYGEVDGLAGPVSRLVLGTMVVSTARQESSNAILDTALEAGINGFDCAHVYGGGDSERAVGQWLAARGHRERVIIVSKGGHHNADRKRVTPYDLESDLQDSLARLQTDYIDLYLLHRDDPDRPVGPLVEALNRFHAAGLVRAFGGSNWTHQRLQEANDYARAHGLIPFTASSPHYSLAEQIDDPWGPGCVGISGPAQSAARQWYQQTGCPIFAYSSLARGLFSGRVRRDNWETVKDSLDAACRRAYCHEPNFQRLDRALELAGRRGVTVPQVALAFVLRQPLNVFPIIGAATPDEVFANQVATTLELSGQELAWLDLRAESPEG